MTQGDSVQLGAAPVSISTHTAERVHGVSEQSEGVENGSSE